MGWCPFFWGNWGTWAGWGIAGLILNIVLFVGLVALAVVGIRWAVRQFAPRSGAGSDALAIARRRLAAGEISIQEFEEIQKRLGA